MKTHTSYELVYTQQSMTGHVYILKCLPTIEYIDNNQTYRMRLYAAHKAIARLGIPMINNNQTYRMRLYAVRETKKGKTTLEKVRPKQYHNRPGTAEAVGHWSFFGDLADSGICFEQIFSPAVLNRLY